MRPLALGLLPTLLVACAPAPQTLSAPPPSPAPAPAVAEEETLEAPHSCDEVCSEETPCRRRCNFDGELMTCGDFGVCGGPPPPPPCNYVPVTSPRICGMDFDGHIWGTRIEIEQETLQRDSNGQGHCPEKYVQTVASRHDCVGTWGSSNTFECCLARLGTLCYYLMPGTCHR